MGERKRSYFENGPTLGETGPSASDPVLPETRRSTLGPALRSAREEAGFSLDDVARNLRIRRSFLQALEEGRFKDLPGVTYATGFLRTYAEHLGLDPEVAVRYFKEEASGAIPKSELYMPKPVPEGRVPGGAMLLMALVLAGGLYGGWYYLTSTGRDVVDLVPPLPDRLVSALDLGPPEAPEVIVPVTGSPVSDSLAGTPELPAVGEPSALGGTGAGTREVADAAAPASSPGMADPGMAVSAAVPAAEAPAPAGGAMPAPAPEAGTQMAAAPPAAAAGTAGEEEEELDGVPAAPMALAAAGAAGTPAAATPPASEIAAVPPPPPAAPPPAEAVPTGRVYGVVNGRSRIQLRATQDSWIQVRDSAGDLLFARVLRPGDVYRAPNESGLKLVTGNAGGLIAVVDGVAAPRPFGQTGQVMRDVALDPQRIANP